MYLSVLPKADLCHLSSVLFHLPDDILLRKHCPYTLLQAVAILHRSQGRYMQDHLHLPDDRSLYTCSRTLQSHLKQGIHGRILPEYRTASCSLLSLLRSTATSNTEPFTTRTSFPCGNSFWKCNPRRTPFVEQD